MTEILQRGDLDDFYVILPCSKWVGTSVALVMSPVLRVLAVMWRNVRQRPVSRAGDSSIAMPQDSEPFSSWSGCVGGQRLQTRHRLTVGVWVPGTRRSPW